MGQLYDLVNKRKKKIAEFLILRGVYSKKEESMLFQLTLSELQEETKAAGALGEKE